MSIVDFAKACLNSAKEMVGYFERTTAAIAAAAGAAAEVPVKLANPSVEVVKLSAALKSGYFKSFDGKLIVGCLFLK